MKSALPWIAAAAALTLLPFVYHAAYPLHILVLVLIWSFVYTSWSVMGCFGLVSLGHGGFMGIGAYVTALLWNHYHLTPWLGIPLAMLTAGVVAVLIGYPCFRFRIIGHNFALLTLALSASVSRAKLCPMMRKRKQGYPISTATTPAVSIASGMPSHGVRW